LTDAKRGKLASISVLDFVGMTSKIIEEDFRQWADPEAASRGSRRRDVQGGHGNGGKCYMTQMFEECSTLLTVKVDKGCRYGVEGGSIRFGYVPDRAEGRGFPVDDLAGTLLGQLEPLGCSLASLPLAAQRALGMADGFSLITGVGPKGLGKQLNARKIRDDLEGHSQMIRTLEMCEVYVIQNGVIQNGGDSLRLPSISPLEGGETPRVVPVPAFLKDPSSGKKVSTTNDGACGAGELILRTSSASMRSGNRRGRHTVNYRTSSGYIGYISVTELDIQSPFRDKIYGECLLESLEPFKLNERGRLAESPLVRAVNGFISREVEEYARVFESKERRKYDQQEKNALSKMNEALNEWKNRFLKEYMRGLWGQGPGDPLPIGPRLPAGKPTRIEISASHGRAGLGVSFRPTVRFWDAGGREVRAVPYRWVSDDTNVAMIDEDLMIVDTYSYGTATLWAETLDGRHRSNQITLEVVEVHNVQIDPSEVEVATGSRHKLDAVCTLGDKSKTTDIYLIWTEDDAGVARVSAAGLVYGFSPGVTQVYAGDDHCLSKNPGVVRVVHGLGGGRGDRKGKGFPLVLVSDVDPDPETGDEVTFSREDPPVWQRPEDADRNMWWINSSAPLARLYLSKDKGYGYESQAWRMYHLERYIDVIAQIAILNGPRESSAISANEWVLEWGAKVAEIQSAAVSDLSSFITTGELPGE
jgi:hypothetical protein